MTTRPPSSVVLMNPKTLLMACRGLPDLIPASLQARRIGALVLVEARLLLALRLPGGFRRCTVLLETALWLMGRWALPDPSHMLEDLLGDLIGSRHDERDPELAFRRKPGASSTWQLPRSLRSAGIAWPGIPATPGA